jgi:hypothetical protein
MPIEVELDVFSGRPNPAWRLDTAREVEFVNRLRALPPARREVSGLPGLGYRGVLVRSSRMGEPRFNMRVYKGIVQDAGGDREDPGRELERWLLKTGSALLDPSLMQMINEEIARL